MVEAGGRAPAVLHELRVRAAIHEHDRGIFPAGVEVRWLHEPRIEERAVRALEGAHLDGTENGVGKRAGRVVDHRGLLAGGVPHDGPRRGCDARVRAYEEGSAGGQRESCLLYTSDAADDLTRVDLGGRRSI